MANQDGDVLLFQTLNDGNINIQNGLVQMTEGLETAVYMSLFSPDDWFGNEAVDTPEEKLSSQTEQVINNKPQSSKNYQLLVQAVEADLKWLVSNGNANSIDVSVTSGGLNRVMISITIEQDSSSNNITLPVEWGANG
ncbi:hypothetical protein NVP1087A_29 [Vibrio phage 1.087.A._10N.261.45.F9]|nr:hypothetical protein [Vibrio phage H188]AUR86610.1 hypothetical protein NVP1087A_29 [Vibrio phage 1.087.A._10N.261.45.F9]